MAAMSAHKDHSLVQENACLALWHLAANNDGSDSLAEFCFSLTLHIYILLLPLPHVILSLLSH